MKTEYTTTHEGYVSGIDDHETILASLALHKEDVDMYANDHLTDNAEDAVWNMKNIGQDPINYPPRKIKLTVIVKIEETEEV